MPNDDKPNRLFTLLENEEVCQRIIQEAEKFGLRIAFGPRNGLIKEKSDRVSKCKPQRSTNIEWLTPEKIQAWTVDPTSFWHSDSNVPPLDGTLGCLYDSTVARIQRDAHNVIQRRLCMLLFWDLTVHMRPDSADSHRKDGLFYDHIARRVQSSSIGNDEFKTISERISEWSFAGRRYSKLMDAVGPSILFALPAIGSTN